jgi:hypothetical protein
MADFRFLPQAQAEFIEQIDTAEGLDQRPDIRHQRRPGARMRRRLQGRT